MTQPYLLDGTRLSRADLLTAPPRDLSDSALWAASARRSLDRRAAAARGARRSPVAATMAVGVAVAASASIAPAISEAHRTTRGTGVSAIQSALGVTADGVMGPATRAAVIAFQRERGLVADGVVGPLTRAALGLGAADTSRRTRGVEARGEWVADVQRRLGIAADGVYGPQTRRAVVAFQSARGLAADGVVGPATRAALGVGSAPATVEGQSAPAPAPAPSGGGAVAAARAQIGKAYAYGGNGPSAFDCSGLTTHAFRAAGIALPRTSFGQYGMGTPVSRSDIQAGDLVFFDSNGPGASHVGVATGPTSFVSATSHGVMETSIDSGYWSQHYVGARRIG